MNTIVRAFIFNKLMKNALHIYTRTCTMQESKYILYKDMAFQQPLQRFVFTYQTIYHPSEPANGAHVRSLDRALENL